jgi:TusA-related sulfurtransferase
MAKNENTVVDTRGQSCPIPLMLTQQAYAKLMAGQQLTVQVGEPVARDNVTRFLRSRGHQPQISQGTDGWTISVVR